MNVASMLWGVVFGSVGFGYFLYGRKQAALVPLVCGLLLMVFPFAVSNPYGMVAIGVGLMSIPYFYRG